jgi:HTH-type transcriptional regulator/antitoxin HipB
MGLKNNNIIRYGDYFISKILMRNRLLTFSLSGIFSLPAPFPCILFPNGITGGAMQHTPASIGTLVRETRKALNLTQADLALTSGTGLRFISELENGKPSCQWGKALIVLQTLGIRITLASPIAIGDDA